MCLLTIAQAAYEDLDVVRMNYINLRSLILSHNRCGGGQSYNFAIKSTAIYEKIHY